MKYKHLFFDLDHTLWDFEANAKATLLELHAALNLEERGVNDFDRFHKNYLAHNEKLWERYRNGFIKQEELRVKRMRLSLLDFKIADDLKVLPVAGRKDLIVFHGRGCNERIRD